MKNKKTFVTIFSTLAILLGPILAVVLFEFITAKEPRKQSQIVTNWHTSLDTPEWYDIGCHPEAEFKVGLIFSNSVYLGKTNAIVLTLWKK